MSTWRPPRGQNIMFKDSLALEHNLNKMIHTKLYRQETKCSQIKLIKTLQIVMFSI